MSVAHNPWKRIALIHPNEKKLQDVSGSIISINKANHRNVFFIALVRWFVPQLDSASKFHKGSSISKVSDCDFETEALTSHQEKMIP